MSGNSEPESDQSCAAGPSAPQGDGAGIVVGRGEVVTDRVTVLLVDDHALLRDMLRDRLAIEEGLQVVGIADDADQGVVQALRLSPDVVLMDVDMPGGSPFEATRKIRADRPGTRVIFLTAHCYDGYIERAFEAGASGYLAKDEAPEAIVAAIREVGAGGTCYSPQVQKRMVIGEATARVSTGRQTRLGMLTVREFEILRHIGRGETTREIALATNIAEKTVGNHTTSIMTKLDIHNRVELARFAIREGIVTL